MKFPITIYQNDQGIYMTECPTIPGCTSQGETEEEAVHNIREVIKKHLHERHEQKLMLMVENREIDVSVNI